MAYTSRGIEEMEFTFCYQRLERRGENPELRRLPWAFVRFADAGEDRKYVMPLPPLGLTAVGGGSPLLDPGALTPPRRSFYEFMEHAPFPLENGTPARVNSNEDDRFPGPQAVHFFGWV